MPPSSIPTYKCECYFLALIIFESLAYANLSTVGATKPIANAAIILGSFDDYFRVSVIFVSIIIIS